MAFLDKFMYDPPRDGTRSAILRNIQLILSTQPLSGSQLQDFGLETDGQPLGTRALLDALGQQLQTTLEKYEPRIVPLALTVGTFSSARVVRFELLCIQAQRPWRLWIDLDTIFGKLRVHEAHDPGAPAEQAGPRSPVTL